MSGSAIHATHDNITSCTKCVCVSCDEIKNKMSPLCVFYMEQYRADVIKVKRFQFRNQQRTLNKDGGHDSVPSEASGFPSGGSI